MTITVLPGDCLELIRTLADNSVDACVTDPPYALTANKQGGTGIASLNENSPAGRSRISTGFMGKAWDTGDVAHSAEFWREVYRVLKPGAHLLAFSGTRTYHRLACAIEDAGFEIRDCVYWTYGSGFPKSHDVSKGIDRAAGAKGTFGAKKANVHSRGDHVLHEGWKRPWMDDPEAVNNSGREYFAASPDAIRWQGWGTALKPAVEPICLARKPLSEGTVAANVLRWGTGAINVDGCRVGIVDEERTVIDTRSGAGFGTIQCEFAGRAEGERFKSHASGRWPANLIHDGSDEVLAAFPESDIGGGPRAAQQTDGSVWGIGAERSPIPGGAIYGDTGSAARFFYSAKADADDRLGSKHPTVKPVDLMQYLVRLVTPKGGLVLDPFAGTGTTGEAAVREGMRAILIERDPDSLADIARRIELLRESSTSRRVAALKARGKIEGPGPLFEGEWQDLKPTSVERLAYGKFAGKPGCLPG